eukprot:9052799-Pyramimonas_sp.AAC.2
MRSFFSKRPSRLMPRSCEQGPRPSAGHTLTVSQCHSVYTCLYTYHIPDARAHQIVRVRWGVSDRACQIGRVR